MIGFGSRHRYYLYTQSTDMRKSFDGLSGMVRNVLGRNPLDGDVYVFQNRTRTIIKLLVWDRTGYSIYSKRLERGTFECPQRSSTEPGADLSWEELVMIMEGIRVQFAQA
jgi:transposase